jgi:hypothetical protein
MNGKGNFKSNYYWSSTEYDDPSTDVDRYAWYFVFSSGVAGYNGKGLTTYVRAVREYCNDCPDNVNIIKNTDNTFKYSCSVKTKDNLATIIYNYKNNLSDQNIGPCYYESNFNLTVYDRWGKAVYKKYNLNSNWDGRDGKTNQLLEDGTYFFSMTLNRANKTIITITGDVEIIRNK